MLKNNSKVSVKDVPANNLSVPVYALDGIKTGTLELPKELFGTAVNKPLLSQAIRVYANNLKGHFSNTKTRSEVRGSTRKIRAQKGTGGARHGLIRAPIFVGGGIALGPKFRKTILDLPVKMKQAALKSALSVKKQEGEIIGMTGFDKVSGKTKQIYTLINKLNKKDILFLLDGINDQFLQAVKNLPNAEVVASNQLNAYEVILHKTLILTKEAVKSLESRLLKEPEVEIPARDKTEKRVRSKKEEK